MVFVWMYCSVWLAVEVMFGGGEPNMNRPGWDTDRREITIV